MAKNRRPSIKIEGLLFVVLINEAKRSINMIMYYDE